MVLVSGRAERYKSWSSRGALQTGENCLQRGSAPSSTARTAFHCLHCALVCLRVERHHCRSAQTLHRPRPCGSVSVTGLSRWEQVRKPWITPPSSPQVPLGSGLLRPCCCQAAVPKASSPAPGSSPPPCGCYLHRFLPREVQEFDVTGLVSALLPGSHRELSQSPSPAVPTVAGQAPASASGQQGGASQAWGRNRNPIGSDNSSSTSLGELENPTSCPSLRMGPAAGPDGGRKRGRARASLRSFWVPAESTPSPLPPFSPPHPSHALPPGLRLPSLPFSLPSHSKQNGCCMAILFSVWKGGSQDAGTWLFFGAHLSRLYVAPAVVREGGKKKRETEKKRTFWNETKVRGREWVVLAYVEH